MLFIEIGNSTLKIARRTSAGFFIVERFTDSDELVARLLREPDSVTVAPVAEGRAAEVLPRIVALATPHNSVRTLDRALFAQFIGDSYDTPGTLGLDRILNLRALNGDGIVISCGTAITVDAVAAGVPRWGAILPGFRTAAQGLSARAPALPTVSESDLGELPARTSHQSVANGVLLGTALAASGLASLLAEHSSLLPEAPLLLTGGDAPLMARLLQTPRRVEVRPALLFEGMEVG